MVINSSDVTSRKFICSIKLVLALLESKHFKIIATECLMARYKNIKSQEPPLHDKYFNYRYLKTFAFYRILQPFACCSQQEFTQIYIFT